MRRKLQANTYDSGRHLCDDSYCCQCDYHSLFPEMLRPGQTHRAKQQRKFAMDTYITMTAYGRDAETALSEAEDKLIDLEQLWSVTDPDSDIYAVNHSDGRPVNISEETAELLSFALQMAEEKQTVLWSRPYTQC